MNKKNENIELSVDSDWAVTTGTSTIRKDKNMVYGLEGLDVTKKPKVVEENLKDSGQGQTWTVTQVKTGKTTDAANTFYTFSINNYFLTGKNSGNRVEGT